MDSLRSFFCGSTTESTSQQPAVNTENLSQSQNILGRIKDQSAKICTFDGDRLYRNLGLVAATLGISALAIGIYVGTALAITVSIVTLIFFLTIAKKCFNYDKLLASLQTTELSPSEKIETIIDNHHIDWNSIHSAKIYMNASLGDRRYQSNSILIQPVHKDIFYEHIDCFVGTAEDKLGKIEEEDELSVGVYALIKMKDNTFSIWKFENNHHNGETDGGGAIFSEVDPESFKDVLKEIGRPEKLPINVHGEII